MSLADELERLHALRRQGALNDDEYALAKAKVLYETSPGREEPTKIPETPPENRPTLSERASGWWRDLRQIRRSERDREIAGVCGGLGEHTSVPSWMWRVIFLAGFLCFGIGLIPYILLWIFMPEPNAQTV